MRKHEYEVTETLTKDQFLLPVLFLFFLFLPILSISMKDLCHHSDHEEVKEGQAWTTERVTTGDRLAESQPVVFIEHAGYEGRI